MRKSTNASFIFDIINRKRSSFFQHLFSHTQLSLSLLKAINNVTFCTNNAY